MWIQPFSFSEDVVTWWSSLGTNPTGNLILHFQFWRTLRSKFLFLINLPNLWLSVTAVYLMIVHWLKGKFAEDFLHVRCSITVTDTRETI